MKRILEYVLPESGVLSVPKGSVILYVHAREDNFVGLGILLNDEMPNVPRLFHVVFGHDPIDAQLWTSFTSSSNALNTDSEKGPHWHYVGSVWIESRRQHIFEERDFHKEY